MPRQILSSACRLPRRAVLPVVLAILSSRVALAGPSSEASDEAIEIGRSALAHYERGLCGEAYAEFQEAEKHAHSPVFLLYMARCKRNERELLAARRLYEQVAAEALPEPAPAPWVHAVVTAKTELRALERSIPSVCVGGEASRVARVSLAGRIVTASGKCEEVELDPGEHSVVVWDEEGRRTTLNLSLAEGQRRVPLPLGTRSEPAASAGPRVGNVPPPVPPRDESASTQKIVGYAALGVGAAGLVVGTIAGVVAAGKASDLACPRDVCPESEAAELRSAEKWASAATIGFIFGGATVAAGLIVLTVVPSGGGGASAHVQVAAPF